MSKYTPPLNTTGIYRVRAPFVVDVTQMYTCVAIRSLVDIRDQGLDPVALYYEPVGLNEVEYTADLAENANVITLKSSTMPTVYIPDTYFTGYPLLDRVPYNHIILSVSLSLVRESLDLSFLQEQISNVVSDVIGVIPEVLIHVAPTTGVITPEQDVVIEAGRQAAITMRTSDYAQRLELQRENIRLREQNQMLLDWVTEHGGIS